MCSGLTTDVLKRGLARMVRRMECCCVALNAADSRLGDGDIGITMALGCRAVWENSTDLSEDVGSALAKCGQVFVQDRGSSFGALLVTGILAAAKQINGEKNVAWTRIPRLLEGSIERMAERGRSNLGDKTVLDSLAAIKDAIAAIADPDKMLEVADKAANQVIEDFRNCESKQGRARMFGEKTIGLDDPGMLVIRELVAALKDCDEDHVTARPD